MTGLQFVKDSLIDLGVIGPGDSLDATVADFHLRKANDWIKSLANERLTMFVLLRTPHTLAASTPSYTIGSGGTINIVRPTKIEAAGLILDLSASPVTEIPIDVFTEQQWQGVRQKDLQSPLVSGIYYDHAYTAALGRITVWPVPTISSTRLVLYTPEALAAFADLDTDYTFAPGYERFLKTNFIKEIAGSVGKSLTSEQIEIARDARANIKRANIRPAELVVDSALLGNAPGFDWRSGQ